MSSFRGKLFIEGTLARLAYLSLYKKHQVVLHGFWRVFLMTLADMIKHRTNPRMKLH